MKRSAQASTPVLLRVSSYPKASLRDGGSDVTESETDPDYSDEQSDADMLDDGLDVSDDDEFEDFYHGGKRRGRASGGKGSKKSQGESSMPVDNMEGEATYASSAIAGMFGNIADDEAEDEGLVTKLNSKNGGGDDTAIDGQRKKRLETLLSKTDKIVNRLNVAMKESMSNVMAAAIEANKADMETKRKMEEEAEEEQRKLREKEGGEDGKKGPSPVKTRKKAAVAAAAAIAAATAMSSTEGAPPNIDNKPVEMEDSAPAPAPTEKADQVEKKFLNKGSLRDYQSGGVEWLGALHEQGLNGILADEMGLGKTLQVLTFLYELHERHRLWGPHLVVMPMSVLSSWKSEVRRFLPDTFDVYVHHGPKESRADDFADWRRRMVATRKARIAALNSANTTTLGSVLKGVLAKASGEEDREKGPRSICICLTTYDIALKDQAMLQRFGRSACRWGYLVVDEAHRLKNRSSLLFEALAKVNASRRLLLSGTPLQNNLGELWSLLSFILPEVFDDIQHFVEWFNRPFEQDSDHEEGQGVGGHSGDKQKGRRGQGKGGSGKAQRKSFKGSKGSAAGKLNPTMHDSLSEEERTLIVSSLHRIMKPFLLRRLKRDVMTEVPQKVERTLVCPRSALQKTLYEVIRSSVESAEGAGAGSKGSSWRSPTDHLQPAKADLLRRNGRPQLLGAGSGEGEGEGEEKEGAQEDALFDALEDHASRIFSSGVSFNNVLMHLRKLCNHPYLLLEDMCSIPDDLYYRYLVSASGKMCVLERLIQTLIPSGHKVIVFSQFTSTMDILQGFFHRLGIASFRLDGTTPRETRESDIADFMSPDPQEYLPGSADGGSSVGRVPVFLLSTRAGGVGINLQAADTVIFFDSDWNPQQDLQAMSRAHRLGQRETVLVIRLVTCGESSEDGYYYPSAEQRILKAAAHKLAAERIVLADGEFDMGTSGAGAGTGGKAAKAMQRENKQLTEALVQDGGIMALFSREDQEGEGRAGQAPAEPDDKLAVSPAAAASVRTRSDGLRSLDAGYLAEITNRGGGAGVPGRLSQGSSATSLDALASTSSSSSSSSSGSSPETDKAADSSADSSRDLLELSSVGPGPAAAMAPSEESPAPTALLEDLCFEQVRDWAPWLGVPPAFEERVREEKARRQRERKAEQERLRLARQEEEARLRAERAAKSAALHQKAVAAREREERREGEGEGEGEGGKSKYSSASTASAAAAAAEGAGAKTVRGWKRKLGRKVHSPNLNEDRLWEGAMDAAEGEASLSEMKKRRGTVAPVVLLEEEDICVLCGEAWVAKGIMKINTKGEETEAAALAMTDKEREQVMLLCDGCSGSYHMVCVGCFEVPEGDWYCDFCRCSEMESDEEN